MYRKLLFLLIGLSLILCGCSKDESLSPSSPETGTGTITFKVTWPSRYYIGKSAGIQAVSTITAYVYSESGSVVTSTELSHEKDRGKAEISVEAGNNYQVRLAAFESSTLLMIGTDTDVDVVAGGTTTADITMSDYLSPTLNNPVSTGSNAYSLSWTSAEYATSYLLQEDDNSNFSSPATAYSGSDLSTVFSDKSPGQYYYRVCSVTQYGNSEWSEAKSLEVGSNGTITIDIPWPNDSGGNLTVLSPLTAIYFTSYATNKLNVTGEIENAGTTNLTNVVVTFIARNSSGTYMDEIMESIGNIDSASRKGFSVTFPNSRFSKYDYPAATVDYTLTCNEGGPFTGTVNIE